jgi:ESF2/ABP1 family protein
MAPAKANDFLDVSDSEDDHLDTYDSDNEIAKGGARSTKRRKVSSDDEDEFDQASDGGADDNKEDGEGEAEEEDEGDDGDDSEKDKTTKNKSKSKSLAVDGELPDITRPLGKKNLVASDAAIKKSGVVYLSRIPPFMKPAKLRSLLEPYGAINRVFLAPEDPEAQKRRVKAGGNKKRSYTEGWVEFLKKKDAKAACELLNARTIGGKKGSYYRDDIWNLVYLKGFKWHNLTEQIATENAERASRMRAEISKTSRENKEFVRNVERAKMLDGIQAKSKKRKAPPAEGEGGEGTESKRKPMTFKQIPLAKKGKDGDEQPEQVTRVLSKIF